MLTETMVVPERSLAQRMSALGKANRNRIRRADTKKAIGRRELSLDEVLDLIVDPPEWMEAMKVLPLLLALPKVGRVKANKVLQSCRISPSKTLGGLSDRQREELVAHGRAGWMRPRGWRPSW